MNSVISNRPSNGTILGLAALVVAIAALVVAVVGPATAAPKRIIVHKGQLAAGSVTAKALAKGAVHAKALAANAVHSSALAADSVTAASLAKGAVGTSALANDAVTAAQIAPGSVYGGALGSITVQTKPITDIDMTAANIEWTASNSEAALCGPGEQVLGAGFAFTNPGNREVGWLQALPFVNGDNRGVIGRITSNAGGTATAEVAAVCLK